MSERLKRDYKNSVFIDMFEQDAYRLQLFQTLHPEMTDVTAEDIQTITLKQVITSHQYNDLAFLVKDRLMVFVEAQSTWSVNILIRVLLNVQKNKLFHRYLPPCLPGAAGCASLPAALKTLKILICYFM